MARCKNLFFPSVAKMSPICEFGMFYLQRRRTRHFVSVCLHYYGAVKNGLTFDVERPEKVDFSNGFAAANGSQFWPILGTIFQKFMTLTHI